MKTALLILSVSAFPLTGCRFPLPPPVVDYGDFTLHHSFLYPKGTAPPESPRLRRTALPGNAFPLRVTVERPRHPVKDGNAGHMLTGLPVG